MFEKRLQKIFDYIVCEVGWKLHSCNIVYVGNFDSERQTQDANNSFVHRWVYLYAYAMVMVPSFSMLHVFVLLYQNRSASYGFPYSVTHT